MATTSTSRLPAYNAFPRLPLYSAFALVMFSIAAVVFGLKTEIGTLRNPTTAAESIRDLSFAELAGDRIAVRDARSGVQLALIGPNEDGFIRGFLRGFGRELRADLARSDLPFDRLADVATLLDRVGLGRAAGSAAAIHQALQRQPIATAASLVAATGLTPATVNKALAHLERIGVVAELTRKQRGRVFSYARYGEILNEGMGLPGRGR